MVKFWLHLIAQMYQKVLWNLTYIWCWQETWFHAQVLVSHVHRKQNTTQKPSLRIRKMFYLKEMQHFSLLPYLQSLDSFDSLYLLLSPTTNYVKNFTSLECYIS